MAVLSLSGALAWWTIIGPHMLLSFGTGLMVAVANAGAVGMFPRLAGTASSIAGLAQMGMGAMGTITVAALSLEVFVAFSDRPAQSLARLSSAIAARIVMKTCPSQDRTTNSTSNLSRTT